jgi:hypothetical protein
MNKNICPENFVEDYSEYLDICLQNTEDNKNTTIKDSVFQNTWKIAELELNHLFQNSKKEPLSPAQSLLKKKTYHIAIQSILEQIKPELEFFHTHQVPNDSYFHKDPRTRLKLLQEVLTPNLVRQSFSREDIKKNGHEELVQNIVIDPRKITNTMLKSFGLEKFIAPARTSQEEKLDLKVQAVPAIKDFFSNDVKPLELHHEVHQSQAKKSYFRLMFIQNGENKGKILGSQANRGKNFFLTNIKNASRRIDNISIGYNKEIQNLTDIQRLIDSIILLMDASSWESLQKGDQLQTIYMDIQSLADSLQYVQNFHKTQMLNKIKKSISFVDSKKRMNPSSRMMMLSSVGTNIGKRIDEISKIQGYLKVDHVRLNSVLQNQLSGILHFCNAVRKYSNDLRLMDLESDIDTDQLQSINTQLEVLHQFCLKLDLHPYNLIAEKIIQEIFEIQQVLNNGYTDRVKARDSFLNIYLLAKCIQCDQQLFEISSLFSYSDTVSDSIYLKFLFEALEEIQEVLSHKDIAADICVLNFSELYHEITLYIDDILLECKTVETLEDEESKKELIGSIKKSVSQFSIQDFFDKCGL